MLVSDANLFAFFTDKVPVAVRQRRLVEKNGYSLLF